MADSKKATAPRTDQPQYKKIVSEDLHCLLPQAASSSHPSKTHESDSKSSDEKQPSKPPTHEQLAPSSKQSPQDDELINEDLVLNVHIRSLPVADSSDANSTGRRSEDQMNEWIYQLTASLQERNAGEAVTITSQNNRRNTLLLLRVKKGVSRKDAGDLLHFLTTIEDIETIEHKGTFRLLPQPTSDPSSKAKEKPTPSEQPREASQSRCVTQ